MKFQTELVVKRNWKYLIILDACRYDYFKKICWDYLDGKLHAVISPASNTIEWAIKTFQRKRKYNDVVYISTNPNINSKLEIQNFDAKAHFYRIIDVWDWGWDEESGTVHPKVVTRAALEAIKLYPRKKFIIHYNQPHTPFYLGGQFIGLGQEHKRKNPRTRRHSFEKILHHLHFFPPSFRKLVGHDIIRKAFGIGTIWKFKSLVGLPPSNPQEIVFLQLGKKGVREAYEETLRLALKYVAMFAKRVSGKIVITADHGELLGENNDYGHPPMRRDPVLVIVPWFEVKGGR